MITHIGTRYINTMIMKNHKQRQKRSRAPAEVRRVVVEFPAPLLNRAEEVRAELAINRSELIRNALERYLEAFKQAKLERELAEGYIANASQARTLCAEFAHLDGDAA